MNEPDPIEPADLEAEVPATDLASADVPPELVEAAIIEPAGVLEVVATEAPTAEELVAEVMAAALAPMPAADPLPGRIDALAETIGKRLDALQASFEREVRAEASRERVVDRLHAELQEYKQGLLLSLMRPVFIDLIQLHDDVGKLVEAGRSEDDTAGSTLLGIQQGIEDILYRQGVEPFTNDGDRFDPKAQRAVSTVPTDEEAQARTVAARIRPGFRSGERVLRPELVSVYAYKP